MKPTTLALTFALSLAVLLAAAPARAGYVSGDDDPIWPFEPDIPDYEGNDDLYTDVLHRTIDISGAPAGAVVTEVEIRVDLHHTYVNDLRVWIGTDTASKVLWDRETTPDDDGIHRWFWAESEFDGEDPNQTWHLYVKDLALEDTGELEFWSVTVWYSDCVDDGDCAVDEQCVNGSCALASCGALGYPLGACEGASSDGDCSADGFEALECVAVGRLDCWELREDCSIGNGICTDPTFGAATCIYSGHGDFCAALGNYGYGCEHGESDCDNDNQCIEGLECMGPLLGGQDGCCEPGEAWTGTECSTTSCEALGYPEGGCGSVGTDGDCAAGFDKVLECQDVGPANCWVVRETCAGETVCWDSTWSAATCIGDGHDDYCAALVAAGSACLWGESDCDGDGECMDGLECKGPLVAGRDGCCEANEDWNGAACVPTDCVTLGYPQGGCGAPGGDGQCSADGSEVWECVDAGPVNCWDVRETCGEDAVCHDPTFAAAACIGSGHGDYCAALVRVGRLCGHGDSDCDSDAHCADGLECQGPTWPLPGDDGCCPADESWNGETCGDFCEAECVPGTSGCDNPTRRWTCGEANDGDDCLDRVVTDCAADQVCQDGRCVSAADCTEAADCPADEHCDSVGRCAPDFCPQGERVCRGDRVTQCNEDGSGEAQIEVCGAGAVCVNGACGCVTDEGCPDDSYCAETTDAAPFFADFAGSAGEPAWTIGQGDLTDPLGGFLCTLDPRAADSVGEAGGAAALTVPADLDPPLCARMTSGRADIGPGSFRVRLRAPGDPHSQGEVLLGDGDAWIALRFEGGGAAVVLSVIANDGHEETRRVPLGFDAAAAQHVYGFDWEVGSIALVVDHVPVADVTATPALSPEGGALALVNWTAVAPNALDGPPPVASTMVVDWVSWAPWPAACVGEVCPAGLRYCEGLQVRQCDDRGTGSTPEGEPCPTNCSGGACVGACADATGCAPTEYCAANGRCEPDVCEQGALFCVDGDLRQCRADGSGDELHEECDNGCRAGACLDPEGCLDDAGCDAAQYCTVAGACVDDVCPQGRTFCAVLERRQCNPNGSDSHLIETCAFACEDGRCASQCVDDEGCAAEQHCSGVNCVADVCEQGAVFCAGDQRRRCNANGSDSELLEICTGGCEGGVCADGPCEPACRGRECGDDGCGSTCGTCPAGRTCSDQGVCVQDCTPTCGAKECGDDGCGGTCGTCPDGSSCDANGTCQADPTCTPDCINRQCGPDGCGGTCGTCGAGEVCNANAQCEVDPGATPGPDTTGGPDAGSTPYESGESSGGCAAGPGPATPWALLLLAFALFAWRRRRA